MRHIFRPSVWMYALSAAGYFFNAVSLYVQHCCHHWIDTQNTARDMMGTDNGGCFFSQRVSFINTEEFLRSEGFVWLANMHGLA